MQRPKKRIGSAKARWLTPATAAENLRTDVATLAAWPYLDSMETEPTVLQPTRQALACQGRSLPNRVTGKLLVALNAMVWKAASRKEAAAIAGLTDHSLRQALKRPHVMRHYLDECETLRLSGRAKRLHHLEELAAQRVNMNAAINAVKAAEGIGDDNHAPGRAAASSPGVTIVIVGNPQPPDREPQTIDITPTDE
jgi:hypothetical protein